MSKLLHALQNYGLKEMGRNRYIARCPVHNEKTASLSIRVKDDGYTLAHCFGCGANGIAVIEALGLETDAIFPESNGDFDKEKYAKKQTKAEIREKIIYYYRVFFLAECDAKRHIKLRTEDRALVREAEKYLNSYNFEKKVYDQLMKQEAKRAEFERSYYNWINNEDKYNLRGELK